MLVELNITDFAIIDQLSLPIHPGFNVITGETGAGKSIIIDAVGMLLGGRADTSFIRSESDKARVEGIFRLSERLKQVINPILEEEGLEGDDDDTLILGREIRSTGRNFCRVNGRTVSLGILKKAAQPLIDIHGQNDHLSLLKVRQHQRFLDRYAGLQDPVATLAKEFRQLKQVRQELHDLLENEQQMARRLDQLSFQLEEIDAANLTVGEEASLTTERNRLNNAEQINQFASEAHRLLVEGDDSQPAAMDLLGQAARLISSLVKLDDSLNEQEQNIHDLSYQVEDLARTLHDYGDTIEIDSGRLQEVEERLALIFNLKRKYGDSIEEVIAFGDRAKSELEVITNSEERIDALRQTEETLRRNIGAMALKLSKQRKQAGQLLSKGVISQLGDLGLEKADFQVEIDWVEDPEGVYVETGDGEKTLACDERGIDRVEFVIAPNPGEPFKPLVKVASGGETSRLMLALKTVLASADETPTLIFDEIDQGIGGRIGGVVGCKLWELAYRSDHQVLCITHLPQIGGYGDIHYHVSKKVSNNRTQTNTRQLTGEDQVEELAQMLGALSDGTRQSAREILEEAALIKANRTNEQAVQKTLL
ncbi:MAG: DNA repair protein RecN [Chloroflexota bacterium]